MTFEVPYFINGKKVLPKGRKLDIYNPATGLLAGHVGVADKGMVNEAVSVAQAAFATWSQTTPKERAKIMFRFKALLDEHIEELAKLVTAEHGKTIAESKGSILR